MKYTNKLINRFEGWTISVDEPYLYDDEGNHYSLDEIRSLHYMRQFMKTMTGSAESRTLVTLKEHLLNKIEAVKTPIINIDWGDGNSQKIVHPDYARKIMN